MRQTLGASSGFSRARNDSTSRLAGLAHVFVFQRRRAEHVGNFCNLMSNCGPREEWGPCIGNRTWQVHRLKSHQRQRVSGSQQASRALAAGEPEMFLQQRAQPAFFLVADAVADFGAAHEFVIAIVASERVAKNVSEPPSHARAEIHSGPTQN